MPAYNPTVDLYQVKLLYTTTLATQPVDHKLQIWMRPDGALATPGALPNAITVRDFANATTDLQTATQAYVDILQPFFSTDGATSTMRFEVWANPANTANQTFITAGGAGLAPSDTNLTVAASQTIFTHRTTSGSILKLYIEEGTVNPGSPLSYNSLSASTRIADLATFMLSVNNTICDRQGGYPIAVLSGFPGENEATFKRRYRP